MVFFMFEPDHFVLTDESVETVRSLWDTYHAFRYDVTIDFHEYLRENGIEVRIAVPDLSSFGYRTGDVQVTLN